MNIRDAKPGDLMAIQSLLKNECLPYEDCADHLQYFVVLENDGQITGEAGLEMYSKRALLRSLVVAPQYQSQGFGVALYLELKKRVDLSEVEQLYVLTETAQSFFEERGFKRIERDCVPDDIRQTKQFTTLCPLSAVVMCLSVR